MGVEYSTSIAWGREVEEKFLKNNLSEFDDDPWTSTYKFCTSEYPGLEFIEGSDNWSGPGRVWVLVISSTLVDISEEAGVFRFKSPTEEEKLQFTNAYARLTGRAEEAEELAVGHIY